jgi:hypothetical protein
MAAAWSGMTIDRGRVSGEIGRPHHRRPAGEVAITLFVIERQFRQVTTREDAAAVSSSATTSA